MEETIEGKTKIVRPLWPGATMSVVMTKDDITAGDGAKRDVLVGKAELATRTTCNVFEYLRRCHVPAAYIGRDGPTTFLTHLCQMIPVEVVVRRIATGSYLRRHPEVAEGICFPCPVVEFFYKTTGRRIGGQVLPCDDPLMTSRVDGVGYNLHLPSRPIVEGDIGRLPISEAESIILAKQLAQCKDLAITVERQLSFAWGKVGGVLYDFKLEFGVRSDGVIVLADVVDCDSWRVIWNGIQLSKQGYRDGDDLGRVLGVYRLAAALTDQWA